MSLSRDPITPARELLMSKLTVLTIVSLRPGGWDMIEFHSAARRSKEVSSCAQVSLFFSLTKKVETHENLKNLPMTDSRRGKVLIC